jgi:hypothetical protein
MALEVASGMTERAVDDTIGKAPHLLLGILVMEAFECALEIVDHVARFVHGGVHLVVAHTEALARPPSMASVAGFTPVGGQAVG